MKPFVSIALFTCILFSMSSFTVVKPPVKKAVRVSRTVPSWPITGTHSIYTYTITGGGNTPAIITFYVGTSVKGSFPFYQPIGSSQWEADVPASSSVYANVRIVLLGIYANQEGYDLDFLPDL